MATRVSQEVYDELAPEVPGLVYYPAARIAALPPAGRGGEDGISGVGGVGGGVAKVGGGEGGEGGEEEAATIAVLCAGTSDLPVAEEVCCHAITTGISN